MVMMIITRRSNREVMVEVVCFVDGCGGERGRVMKVAVGGLWTVGIRYTLLLPFYEGLSQWKYWYKVPLTARRVMRLKKVLSTVVVGTAKAHYRTCIIPLAIQWL